MLLHTSVIPWRLWRLNVYTSHLHRCSTPYFMSLRFVAESDSVIVCVKLFRRNHYKAQHVFYSLCGEGFDVANLLLVIAVAVNLWWGRRCPSRLFLKGFGKEMKKYLNDFPFWVDMTCGVETILYNINIVWVYVTLIRPLQCLQYISQMFLMWWIDRITSWSHVEVPFYFSMSQMFLMYVGDKHI